MPKNPDIKIPNDIELTNANTAFHAKTKSVAKKIKEPIIQTAADIKINGEYLIKLQHVGLK